MKKLLFFTICVAIFAGCASQNLTATNQECEDNAVLKSCGVEKLQIPSVFTAAILCPECQSATSTLSLNTDKTFKLETILNKKSVQRTLESGSYTIKGDTLTLVNQYKEIKEFRFDGVNLIKLESKDSFIKESLFQNTIYRPVKN